MIQTTLAAELESLAAFRALIDSACQGQAGLDEQTIYDLKLAVDEACANIIQHGYAGMNPGSIILSLELTPSQARIVITDFGHPFEPCEPPRPDLSAALDDRSMEGFGLYFIYQTMDEVGYEANEDGNCLTLVKRLAVSEEG